ncbi:pro-interleukin-16-like [Heterodontus francisci]|uniref:pro-interleukin-16-like n=1 Tax=Heterodontus francisci TaxID=7792 RepID=UPI00355BA124
MEPKFSWSFRGSKVASSESKASSRPSLTKSAKPSEVTPPKAKVLGPSKQEAPEEQKPRSSSLFSGRSGDSRAPSGGIAPRKLSLHEQWKGAGSQYAGLGGHHRSSSMGATQFWKAMESGKQKDGEKGKKADEPNAGQRGVRFRGSGVLGLTESIRKRCESFVTPKAPARDVGAPAKREEGRGSRVAETSGAGNPEKQRARSNSAGPVPERPSLVMQTIHSFEQAMRQRHTRRCSRQEHPAKTSADGSSAPPPGKAEDDVATDPQRAKQPSRASNDSVAGLPRATSTSQPASEDPRAGSSAPEGLTGRQSEDSSQSLPSNASPAARRSSPEVEAGACNLGQSSRENDAMVLEVHSQLMVEVPRASSPCGVCSEVNSPLGKVVLSPSVKSDDEWSLSDETHSDISQLDKSYSISLAELQECGMECREEVRRGDRLNHSASLNSNMSFMSVVSLIPNDELDRLLDEVKCLEEGALQCAEDIQVVVLHKEEGTGLGFTIAGGMDHENKMVTAHKVFPNGLAAQEGTIEHGDEILSINGNSLKGVTHSEALSFLHKARPPKQAIVVVRKMTEAERATLRKASVSNDKPRGSVDLSAVPESSGESVTVELMTSGAGLGFSLDGGKSSSQGDRPLTIKKVFPGGPADRNGLIQPGDRLVKVRDQDYQELTCYEAWNLIKSLPAGPVRVVIRKKAEGTSGQQS